jgi:putative membrane protein
MNLAVSHWSANTVVIVACAAVVVVHLAGMRVIAVGAGRRWPIGVTTEAVAFYLGVAVVVIALLSPVGYWAQKFIWIRSVQDLLLAVAAPGLIVLGAPWLALAAGLRRSPGQVGESPAAAEHERRSPASSAPPAAAGRYWPARPVAVAVGFNLAWWGWHMPAPYDAALRYPGVYAAEVVVYLGLGVAFWLQLIGSGPFTPLLRPLRRLALVIGTAASTTVLAMVLVFGSGLLYSAYLGAGHHVLGVVADQQVGGAVLWAAGLPPLTIVAIALLFTWLGEEESDSLTAGFDRLLKPPKSAWPSRPGLR